MAAIMTSRQAAELDHALERCGWTAEDVKWLSGGNTLSQIRLVRLGHFEIKPIEHLIDFDKAPSVPNGWTILPDDEQLPNRVHGAVKFDPAKVKLHLDDGQKNGKRIGGHDLRKKLTEVPVYGAQLGDFYLVNPHLIPDEWKSKAIFFWGTIYRRSSDRLCVRCLCRDSGRWYWNYYWFDSDWFGGDPAVVSAS